MDGVVCSSGRWLTVHLHLEWSIWGPSTKVAVVEEWWCHGGESFDQLFEVSKGVATVATSG